MFDYHPVAEKEKAGESSISKHESIH